MRRSGRSNPNPYNLDLREQLAQCYDQLGETEKAAQIRAGTDVLDDQE